MSVDSEFRPDIEGLRALAILAVLAFHYEGAPFFAGGYIGVDVFFVISGYLITKNVFTQASYGDFLFRDFYIRRAGRLIPALFFIIVLTLVGGICISSPADLKHIGESAIASIFSVSNIYFWSQAGYFDTSAIQKPLLHTWALSVEWQFYLLWPAVVVLLVRYLKNYKYAIVALGAMGVLSFFAAELVMGRDAPGAFYLTPYRIGEFALGAIFALIPLLRSNLLWIRNGLVLLGFSLIFFAVFGYSETTRFPGVAALIPCVGAVLLIRFGEHSIASPVMTNRFVVGLGRVSYSLYLVHWPLYVFARQWYGSDFGLGGKFAIGILSLILAIVMHRFIEQPFRIQNKPVFISTRSFVKLFAGLTVCLLILSAAIWSGKGWAWRFPSDIAKFANEAEVEKNARFTFYRERCLSGSSVSCNEPVAGVNVFIVGDSHALDAFNALATQYPQYHYVVNGLPGCPPLVREDYNLLTVKHPDRDGCIARNEALLYSDRLSTADLVVINTVFSWYKPEHLEHTIAQIRKKTSAPMLVLGNYMFFNGDVADMILRHDSTTMNPVYEKNLAWHSFAFDKELKALSAKLDFTYISKRDLLCRGDSINDCPLIFEDKLFTYDRHHFSVAAARQMGLSLKNLYNDIFIGLEQPTYSRKIHETLN